MMGHKMCKLHKISWILLLVGGLNWGLVGLVNVDLVDMVFGSWPLVARIVYILVGLSAVMMLFKKKCKACHADGGMKEAPKMDAPKPEGGMPQGGMQH